MQKGTGGQLMVFAGPVSSVDHAPALCLSRLLLAQLCPAQVI